MMTLIRRMSPFGDLLPLDVELTADALVIEAALPGVRPEDIDLELDGDTLTISATTGSDEPDERGGRRYREMRRGVVSRTLRLPAGLQSDGTVATSEHGLLRLAIPRTTEARPRRIPVTTAAVAAADATDTAEPVDVPVAA